MKNALGSVATLLIQFHRLLRCEQFDKPSAELIKSICLSNVAVQTDGKKLSQHINLAEAAVATIPVNSKSYPI